MREKKEKPTIDMCYYKEGPEGPCTEAPQWKLKGETKRFKVCDQHLAWGIRLSGYPALVDKYEAIPKGKVEECNKPEIHKDFAGSALDKK